MKTLKKFYIHIIILGFFTFAAVGAYYSTPMLPDVQIEFKGSIRKDIHKWPAPVSPVRKYRLDI